jgi:hypothetical protein
MADVGFNHNYDTQAYAVRHNSSSILGNTVHMVRHGAITPRGLLPQCQCCRVQGAVVRPSMCLGHTSPEHAVLLLTLGPHSHVRKLN